MKYMYNKALCITVCLNFNKDQNIAPVLILEISRSRRFSLNMLHKIIPNSNMTNALSAYKRSIFLKIWELWRKKNLQGSAQAAKSSSVYFLVVRSPQGRTAHADFSGLFIFKLTFLPQRLPGAPRNRERIHCFSYLNEALLAVIASVAKGSFVNVVLRQDTIKDIIWCVRQGECYSNFGFTLSGRNKHWVLSALPDACEKLQAARAGFELATPGFQFRRLILL
jgi:hypothetical protein